MSDEADFREKHYGGIFYKDKTVLPKELCLLQRTELQIKSKTWQNHKEKQKNP